MHSDQSVSLRPGGGKGRPQAPRINSNSSSSSTENSFSDACIALQHGKGADLKDSKSEVERIKYTKDFLYNLKDVSTTVTQEIRDAVVEIETELRVSEETIEWSRPAIQVLSLPSSSRFLETNSRDWKTKPISDEKVHEQPVKDAGKKSDNDWRVNREPETGKKSNNDWRVNKEPEVGKKTADSDWRANKEPEHNGSILKNLSIQEPLVSHFPPRQHETPFMRQQEPQYIRQQEFYHNSRQHEPFFHSRHQEPPNSRHEESLYRRLQEAAAVPADAVQMAAISRVANPWMAKRGVLSEKEQVLRTVKGILNKLTPEKFSVLVEQLMHSGIDSSDILKGVISLVFDKAVLEPTFCPLYAELCAHLSKALPEFPSDEEDGKPVTFRRILLNICQEEFEGADTLQDEIRRLTKPEQEVERFEKEKLVKLRTLGNIRLIGELFKLKIIPEKIVHYCIHMLLGSDPRTPPAEENIEALCQLFVTVGKQLEESNKTTKALDLYFSQLKDYSSNSRLPSRIRFLILNTIDLRANKWVPRREEVRARTLNEIHAEAERTLGLRPGMMGMRNEWGAPGVMGLPAMGNQFSQIRPGSMMPGMPGLLPVTGMMPGPAPLLPGFFPGVDPEAWQNAIARRNKTGREGLIPPPGVPSGGPFGVPYAGMRPIIPPNTRYRSPGNNPTYMGRPSALLGDAFGGRPVMSTPPLSMRQGPRGPYIAPNVVSMKSSVLGNMERAEAPLKLPTTTNTAIPPAILQKKWDSLFQEFFSVGDLDEALLCVQELKSPEFYAQLIQVGVTMALESTDRGRELMNRLLEVLWSKGVVSEGDVRAGLLMVAEQMGDLALDIPMAPKHVGSLFGRACLGGVADLGLLVDIIQKVEDPLLRRPVYEAAVKTIKLGPNSERLLSTRRAKLQECERLVHR